MPLAADDVADAIDRHLEVERAHPLDHLIAALTVGVEEDTLTRDIEGEHTARLTVRLEPGDVPANQRGPVVAALPSGGFLLAWREGRRLRARPLDAALRATGPIVEIANDIDLVPAPGALGVRHDRVLSLYGVRSGNATELWGAVLSCS